MSTSQRRGVAVVTGGSAGVGRAIVQQLAAKGFDVGIIARGQAGLDAAADDVRKHGRTAVAVAADVADWTGVDGAATRIEDELGPMDVWVNNAMATVFSWSWDVEPNEYRRATEVTYLGQVHGTLAALHRMRRRDRGRIVNVGSALAYVGIPLQSAYCAAKFACRGFSESVRAELLHEGSGVTLSMVHLPAINTPQFDWSETHLPKHPQPVPPIYGPEIAARHVVAAALDGRRSKVLGAWNKVIVVGGKVAPSVISHYAALSAVAGQQTDEAVAPDRPSNLWKPADDSRDHGSHGAFSDRQGGFLDSSFLVSLPKTATDAATAVAHAVRFRIDRARRHRVLRQ
ncbi:MAG TPA: SDR family oxidoreductase [Acidimicrobiales bacterium]|nr:SDR family oxidoreductase [Acidimicrobiales bacterium]